MKETLARVNGPFDNESGDVIITTATAREIADEIISDVREEIRANKESDAGGSLMRLVSQKVDARIRKQIKELNDQRKQREADIEFERRVAKMSPEAATAARAAREKTIAARAGKGEERVSDREMETALRGDPEATAKVLGRIRAIATNRDPSGRIRTDAIIRILRRAREVFDTLKAENPNLAELKWLTELESFASKGTVGGDNRGRSEAWVAKVNQIEAATQSTINAEVENRSKQRDEQAQRILDALLDNPSSPRAESPEAFARRVARIEQAVRKILDRPENQKLTPGVLRATAKTLSVDAPTTAGANATLRWLAAALKAPRDPDVVNDLRAVETFIAAEDYTGAIETLRETAEVEATGLGTGGATDDASGEGDFDARESAFAAMVDLDGISNLTPEQIIERLRDSDAGGAAELGKRTQPGIFGGRERQGFADLLLGTLGSLKKGVEVVTIYQQEGSKGSKATRFFEKNQNIRSVQQRKNPYKTLFVRFARTPALAELGKRLSEVAGDVPLVAVDGSLWAEIAEESNTIPAGLFVPSTTKEIAEGAPAGTIFIPEDLILYPNEPYLGVAGLDETVAHELVHAATVMTLLKDTALRARAERLMQFVADKLGNAPRSDYMTYALSSPHEFITMAMTNREVQRVLEGISISKAEQARIGIFGTFRNAWAAFVQLVRSALGLPRLPASVDAEAMSALEASILLGAEGIQANDERMLDALAYLVNQHSRPEDTAAAPLAVMKRLSVAAAPSTSSITEWFKRTGLGFATLRQIEMMSAGLFKRTVRMDMIDPNGRDDPLTMGVKALTERAQIAESYLSTNIVPLLQAWDMQPEEIATLNDFMLKATLAEVHPDVPLTDPKNAHILSKKGTPKGAREAQAQALHGVLSAEWAKLTPKQQAVYKKIVASMEKIHKDMLVALMQSNVERWWRAQVDEAIRANTPLPLRHRDLEPLALRWATGVETAQDRTLVGDATAEILDTTRNRGKLAGPYIPLQRFGDYIVRWKESPQSIYKFATRADREAFAAKSSLPVLNDSITRYYDAQGNEITKPDPAILKAEQAVQRGLLGSAPTPQEIAAANRKAYKAALNKTRKAAAKVEYELELQTQGVAFFETRAEAETFRQELVQQKKHEVAEIALRAEAEGTVSMLDAEGQRLLKYIEDDKTLTPKQKEIAVRAASDALLQLTPNRLLNNTLIKRRRVAGANKDIRRVIANYGISASNYYAGVKTAQRIADAMRGMQDNIKSEEYPQGGTTDTGNTVRRQRVLREFEERAASSSVDPAGRGSTNKFIRTLQSMAFSYYLLSPSYSMIQITQPWMLAAPILSARYGARGNVELARAVNSIGAGRVLKGGAKEFARTVKTLGTGKEKQALDLLSLVKSAVGKQSDGAELNAMLDELAKEGLIDASAGLELVRTVQASQGWAATKLAQTEAMARAFPSSIEVVNRAMTAVATYRLARRAGKDARAATAEAREVVDLSQADYSSANTARYMDARRYPLLAPMMTFRKYAQAVYFLLIRQIYLAVKGKSPEERAVARKTLAYVLLTHAVMAGVLGLPTEVFVIAAGALALLFGADEPPDWETEVRKQLAALMGPTAEQAISRGIPSAFGVDMSTRLGLDGLIFLKDLRDYESRTLTHYAGEFILGAPGSMLVAALSAPKLAFSGDYARAAEAVTPKAIRDVIRALRLSEEGVTNRRGERIDGGKDFSTSEAIIQAVGFTPTRVSNIYERRNAVQGELRRFDRKRSELLRALRQAETYEERRKALLAIDDFNRNLSPEQIPARITRDNIRQSMREKMRREREAVDGIYVPRSRRFVLDEGRFGTD